LEEVEVANGIEALARRMLRAAYRRRGDMFGAEDVVAPRDDPVVRELGYDD
jgi:DNA-directed RNA polymerase specialized sigma24 family protein